MITEKHREELKRVLIIQFEKCQDCGWLDKEDLVVYFKDQDNTNFKAKNLRLLCKRCKDQKANRYTIPQQKPSQNHSMDKLGFIVVPDHLKKQQGEVPYTSTDEFNSLVSDAVSGAVIESIRDVKGKIFLKTTD